MFKKLVDLELSRNQQTIINITAAVVNMLVTTLISFVLSPYIVTNFGAEANGFTQLANNFVNYASLLTIALNSMASRFLMLERTRGNVTAVSQYFSSITLANVILSAILTVPSVICVVFLEKFLAIPDVLVVEEKLTFAVTFASFIANLYFSTYSNCFYLTNKLSIGSIRDAIMNVLRIASIILLFSLTTPRISYVATGGLIATAFAVVFNYY